MDIYHLYFDIKNRHVFLILLIFFQVNYNKAKINYNFLHLPYKFHSYKYSTTDPELNLISKKISLIRSLKTKKLFVLL